MSQSVNESLTLRRKIDQIDEGCKDCSCAFWLGECDVIRAEVLDLGSSSTPLTSGNHVKSYIRLKQSIHAHMKEQEIT